MLQPGPVRFAGTAAVVAADHLAAEAGRTSCGSEGRRRMEGWRPPGPGPADGFSTWRAEGRVVVEVEGHAPPAWAEGLVERGHDVRRAPAFSSRFGHAHAIVVRPEGSLEAAADPRSPAGGVVGW